EGARELGVGDRDGEDGLEQRGPRNERRVDRLETSLERRHLPLDRVVVVDAEQAAPDLAPHEVRVLGPERLALAERDGAASPADGAHELRDEPRLAHAGLGGDADDPALAIDRLVQALVELRQLARSAD